MACGVRETATNMVSTKGPAAVPQRKDDCQMRSAHSVANLEHTASKRPSADYQRFNVDQFNRLLQGKSRQLQESRGGLNSSQRKQVWAYVR